ncbi:NAD-dependent epimerase/dehydratase family protein [Phenylobacterium deserti]|uniref:NAD-dependent epimerase/dehydratase domain-containing protein n=1 Tax=Phenylobacterium deserti TaxID=1914756 RepID=A0A328ASK1_9CAUL|nr:NAD-dependent epimerase/dehydratase family protein [Phenylobacterium deserti]RAK57241.1 hypothetical protein DJ018_04650 [Phenylobacterium deserti]
MEQDNAPLALVIGATGGIGGAVAERLVARGWRVRALNRSPQTAKGPRGLEWVQGDAMLAADVRRAAEGAQLIFHGANPPGYRGWGALVLPMLRNTIAAAEAIGARILFPGTIYNYGPDAFPLIDEDAPQQPTTRKGAIRVQMEAALAEAASAGTPVTIVRAGDFFGPKAGNTWFSQGLIKPNEPLSSITYPGPLAVEHSWAYLPDLAQAMVRLVEQPGAGAFESYHLAGHRMTGRQLVAELEQVAGRRLAVKRLPWLALKAMSPFNETLRELMEVRYLWETPVLLDNTRLRARLGEEPHTPLATALETTLRGMGALPQYPAALAA